MVGLPPQNKAPLFQFPCHLSSLWLFPSTSREATRGRRPVHSSRGCFSFGEAGQLLELIVSSAKACEFIIESYLFQETLVKSRLFWRLVQGVCSFSLYNPKSNQISAALFLSLGTVAHAAEKCAAHRPDLMHLFFSFCSRGCELSSRVARRIVQRRRSSLRTF